MKRLFLALFALLLTSLAFGQNEGDYRSRQTGNWSTSTTWQVFVNGNWEDLESGNAGAFQDVIPTDQSLAINIRSPHSVTVTADLLIDETIIDVGGTVILNSGINLDFPLFTFADVLTINGTFNNSGNFNAGILSNVQINGVFINNQGATINNSDPGWVFFNANSTYDHRYTTSNGDLPLATWDDASTCLISGYTTNFTAPTNLNQEFGNFTWNTASFNVASPNNFINLSGQLTTVDGNLTVTSTGTSGRSLRFASTGEAGFTLDIGGELRLNGGIVQFVLNTSSATTINIDQNYVQTLANVVLTQTLGDVTINIAGNFSKTGGTITRLASGVATFNFNGGGVTQTYGFSGTAITSAVNFSVTSGSVLSLGTSSLAGLGTLTNNGTIVLGSTDGAGAIQVGAGTAGNNIRVTGTRTYANGSTLRYGPASGAQSMGGGHPSTIGVNCEINNSSGVTLVADVTIGGNLTLTSGNLSLSTRTLTLNGSFTPNSNFLNVTSNSSISIGGTGAFGTLAITGSTTINNFTINRTSSGSVTLGTDLTIGGTLTQTFGDIVLNGRTFTISGPYIRSNGGFNVDAAASFIVNGSGALPTDVTFNGGALNTITLNRSSSTFPTNSALTLTNLNLLSGTFNNTGTITMNQGGVLTRTEGSIINNTPTTNPTTNSYDVVYDIANDISTGAEIPSLTTQLRNVTKTGGAALLLTEAVTINGNLTVTNGSFNASTFAIDLKGNFIANSTSTLTSSPFTFSGTTSISGGAVVRFGDVTVSGSLTPTINIRIDGNLVNNGTLVAGQFTQASQ